MCLPRGPKLSLREVALVTAGARIGKLARLATFSNLVSRRRISDTDS